MNEIINPLNIIILLNNIALIIFILNQNDSLKDSATTQNSRSPKNPLESMTWAGFLLQLSFLLIKIKALNFT